MKPATVCFRSWGLAAGLLACAVNSHAGLQFNGSIPDVRLAVNKEEASIQKAVVEAETTLANEKLRCKGNQSCEDAAQRKFRTAIDATTIRKNTNQATLKKWQYETERNRTYKPALPADEEPEHLRHYKAETEFVKRGIDLGTQFANDKVRCGDPDSAATSATSATAGCIAQAQTKFKDAELQLRTDINIEFGTNRKNLIDVRSRRTANTN